MDCRWSATDCEGRINRLIAISSYRDMGFKFERIISPIRFVGVRSQVVLSRDLSCHLNSFSVLDLPGQMSCIYGPSGRHAVELDSLGWWRTEEMASISQGLIVAFLFIFHAVYF